MNKLFDIFKNEKDRNPDLTVLYFKGNDKLDKSLTYFLEGEDGKKSQLKVLFKNGGIEEFYYRKPDEKGLGALVQTVADKGRIGELTNEFSDMPARFKEVAQSYQYDRDAIGIDKKPNKPYEKPNTSYER